MRGNIKLILSVPSLIIEWKKALIDTMLKEIKKGKFFGYIQRFSWCGIRR